MKNGLSIDIPKYTANFGVNWDADEKVNCNFIGKWSSKIESPHKNGPVTTLNYQEIKLPPFIFFDFAITLNKIFKNVKFVFNVNNIFNKKYYLGGSEFYCSQPGRWFLFELGYKI